MIKTSLRRFSRIFTLCTLIAAISAPAALADGASARATRKLAIAGTMLGEPYPSIFGFDVGYNMTPWLQPHVGYSSNSYGAGVKLFVPSWNFSPTVGVGYSLLSTTGSFVVGSTTISGSGSEGILHMTAGAEWQTGFGLLLGFTYQMGLSGAMQSVPLTGFKLGWTF